MGQCQDFLSAGDHRWYYEYGLAVADTTFPRGGVGKCWRFTPTSATYYISSAEVFRAWQTGGGDTALCIWLRKDATFNGDVQLEAWFGGKQVVATTPAVVTTTYAKYSLTALAANLPYAGMVELRIRVRGTAGNCYLDSFMEVN